MLLSNVPSPYLSPVYDALKAEANWDLRVCYLALWNAGVAWSPAAAQQYLSAQNVILAQQNARLTKLLGAQVAATVQLLSQLVRFRPDYLLIYGYTQLPQMTLLLWAALFGVPFAIAGDANYYTDNVAGWRGALKRWWLNSLVQRAAALIVVGKACRMFWERYGAQPQQIFHAGFAVDNDYFQRECAKARPAALQERQTLGWEQATVFLYVGRLIERKNVHHLVAALKQVKDAPVALLIAGDGPASEALQLLAQEDERIRFVGRLTQQELPYYYGMSDVLVLPAQAEPWGLVVNEAMACGLAVIAHQHCGATLDLVGDDNGVALQSHTEAELKDALSRLAKDKGMLAQMRQQSLAKIQSWSMASAAVGIRNAVESSGNFSGRFRQSEVVISSERSDAK